MRHFLYEITNENCEAYGEEIIIGAEDRKEARKIGVAEFGGVRFICELSEEEAEASGLDEY